MPTQSFIVNGERVSVDVEDDVRLLWVLRDLLGVTGPKYGCGLSVCQACTSQVNGKTFNPCAVPVGDLTDDDHVTTIEGLANAFAESGGPDDLHPVQDVWLEQDVAQCGFCQPGQIMAAVGLIETTRAEGRAITDDDLDQLRNVCRCGTYPRVRNAIMAAAERPWTARLPDPTAPQPATPQAEAPQAEAVVPQASARAATAASLPATGIDSLLGPAALAAGTAVAIRVASDRGSPGAVPAEADAGEAERRDTDG